MGSERSGWLAVGLSSLLVGCGDSGGQTAGATEGSQGTDTGGAGSSDTGGSDTEAPETPTSTTSPSGGVSDSDSAVSESDGTTGPLPTTGPATETAATTEATSTGGVAVCGDGVLAGDEACDDGDDNGAGQPCKSDCTLNVCGDGDAGPGEGCDEGGANGPDSACSAACAYNPQPCGELTFAASTITVPIDIILAIDNSGSMTDEILAVQDKINASFAAQFEALGLDYRVILVARHGSALAGQSVCIEAPLSGIPQGGCAAPPLQPVFNPGKFYHYSIEIGSFDVLSKLIASYAANDMYNLIAGGWKTLLRVDARKSFVIITDDNSSTPAAVFESQLQAMDPAQFGAGPDTRTYDVHTILGVAAQGAEGTPYGPQEPVQASKCPSAVNPGAVHQALSIATGGLRFPVCEIPAYGFMFEAIADAVTQQVPIVCSFPLPPPPPGQVRSLADTVFEYQPGVGMPVALGLVAGPDDCAANGFYAEADQLVLCPETCEGVQGDVEAQVNIDLYCTPG